MNNKIVLSLSLFALISAACGGVESHTAGAGTQVSALAGESGRVSTILYQDGDARLAVEFDGRNRVEIHDLDGGDQPQSIEIDNQKLPKGLEVWESYTRGLRAKLDGNQFGFKFTPPPCAIDLEHPNGECDPVPVAPLH